MPDRYTKIILTVIAVCLVWICVRDVAFLTPAAAQTRRDRGMRQPPPSAERTATQEAADQLAAMRNAPPINVRVVDVGEELFRNWPMHALLPVDVQAGAVNIGNYPPIRVLIQD